MSPVRTLVLALQADRLRDLTRAQIDDVVALFCAQMETKANACTAPGTTGL